MKEEVVLCISPGLLNLAGKVLDAYEPFNVQIEPYSMVFIQGDKKSSIGITVDTPIENLEKTEWNVKVTDAFMDFIALIPDDTWVWEQKLECLEEEIALFGRYCFGRHYEGMYASFECHLKELDQNIAFKYMEYLKRYNEAMSNIPEIYVSLYPDKIEFQYWVGPDQCIGTVTICLTEN